MCQPASNCFQSWQVSRSIQTDTSCAGALDGMADRIEGKEATREENLEDSLKRLERTTMTCCTVSFSGECPPDLIGRGPC